MGVGRENPHYLIFPELKYKINLLEHKNGNKYPRAIKRFLVSSRSRESS
jgi:hypothetical protein